MKKLTKLIDKQYEFVVGSGATTGRQPVMLRRWFPFLIMIYLTLVSGAIYLIVWKLTQLP